MNPGIGVIEVSATKGHGMADWLAWIEQGVASAHAPHAASVDALNARIAELEARVAALNRRLGE